jgi:hypothetical protein
MGWNRLCQLRTVKFSSAWLNGLSRFEIIIIV